MENQPIRIMVPFDSIEDKEILEQMPKWAKGSWIREQVRKTILMEKDLRNQEILELVNMHLREQGSVTQEQVKLWILEVLQQHSGGTKDRVQDVVAEVLQKQTVITEQKVKQWVNEAVSVLQVTVYQETISEPVKELPGEPVLKSYEVLGNESVKHEDPANSREKRTLRRSVQDVVRRRPAVKLIEQNVPAQLANENDEYAEYGSVDFTHLSDIEGFGID